MKKVLLWGFALVLVGLGLWVSPRLAKLRVKIPAFDPPGEIVKLDQGWSEAQRLEFHHTAQGTRLLPYSWFLALEQPCLWPGGCDLFAREEYLGRFGFLRSAVDPQWNPDGLPVGFARQVDFVEPDGSPSYAVVGLTCAACHTGELRYGNRAIRVEGAPAMIQVTQLQKAMGLALQLTAWIPWRYRAFEERVLGRDATEEQKAQLHLAVDKFLKGAKAELLATEKASIYAYDAGFIRTDALTRIGNQVFAADMGIEANYAPAQAPVKFPPIWDSSWFVWVQYNSSIADPLVRNIGEALGVRALAQLSGPTAKEYANSVNLPGLKHLEDLLSGPQPYAGLRPPRWPAVFPPLDSAKVVHGERLYREHCQGCHLPPQGDLENDLASNSPQYWVQNSTGRRFLNLRDIPVEVVGTDPNQAVSFQKRTADSGDLGQGRISAAAGLQLVTEGIRDRFFRLAQMAPEERLAWQGYRDGSVPPVRAEAIYKARPLQGIWASAPYLHNGSVPTLYELLASRQQRPAHVFWLGSKQFDPERVGYLTTEREGDFRFDPAEPGNSNVGHWFEDGPRGNGVVGPALSESERWALVEYLKSI